MVRFFSLAAVAAILFLASAAQSVDAAPRPRPLAVVPACSAVTQYTAFSYNQNPLFGSNTLSWSSASAPANQAWLVERSDDNGVTYVPVRTSTSRTISTGYLGDTVRYRITGVSSVARPCAPDSTPFVWDPPVSGFTNTSV